MNPDLCLALLLIICSHYKKLYSLNNQFLSKFHQNSLFLLFWLTNTDVSVSKSSISQIKIFIHYTNNSDKQTIVHENAAFLIHQDSLMGILVFSFEQTALLAA